MILINNKFRVYLPLEYGVEFYSINKCQLPEFINNSYSFLKLNFLPFNNLENILNIPKLIKEQIKNNIEIDITVNILDNDCTNSSYKLIYTIEDIVNFKTSILDYSNNDNFEIFSEFSIKRIIIYNVKTKSHIIIFDKNTI